MGIQEDRAALRALQSATITAPGIIAIFSDACYDPEVREEAIRHRTCTLESLRHVLDAGSEAIVDRIAACSRDPEVLAYLAAKGPSDRRAIVAYNADTPPWLLAQLSMDPDPIVRENVHVNPATPPEAVAVLENDDVEDVREARENWWTYWDENSGGIRARAWGIRLALQAWARRWRI